MEFLSLIFIISLGIFFGIISGLIPGIHINMISTFLVSNFLFLSKFFNLEEIIIFIISMSVVHTFFDFIPSILIGVPDSDTALSILPGQVLVLQGEAYKAIFLSALGSLLGSIISFFAAIIFYFTLELLYNSFKAYIPYILILSLFSLILMEKDNSQRFWSFVIVLFSGGYGILILNSKLISEPLLILFSGIFGVSSIVYTFMNKESNFPKQNFNIDFKFDFKIVKALSIGLVSSAICSITPGIGNSQAAILSSVFVRNITSEIFIIVLGSINTIGFILSIMTFYLIERARNGSIVAISQIIEKITFQDTIFYFSIVFLVSIVSFILMIKIGKVMIDFAQKVNIKIVNLVVLSLIFVIVFFFDSFYGVFVLLGCSFLGLFCLSLNVGRVHLMSVLLVPVILNLI
jgi:putative membrane protein